MKHDYNLRLWTISTQWCFYIFSVVSRSVKALVASVEGKWAAGALVIMSGERAYKKVGKVARCLHMYSNTTNGTICVKTVLNNTRIRRD